VSPSREPAIPQAMQQHGGRNHSPMKVLPRAPEPKPADMHDIKSAAETPPSDAARPVANAGSSRDQVARRDGV
jgi:hypothetical protein